MNPPDKSRSRQPGYNPRTGGYHLYHDWESETSVIETVLRSVAAITNCDPTDLESPTRAVDTDALNALFRPIAHGRARNMGYVSFPLNGCDVIVHADGEVEVHPPAISSPTLFGDMSGDDH